MRNKLSFLRTLSTFLLFSIMLCSVALVTPPLAHAQTSPPMPDVPPDSAFDPLQGPTSATFDTLNPFIIGGSQQAETLSTPGGVISRLLQFSFPLAGLVLFVMLVWGGAEILMGAANKKSVDAGKQRLTSALVGFALLFSTYWIAQILEYVFGIIILG